MSNTHKHKTEAKFNNGEIQLSDVSISVRNKWSRKNFTWGRYRKQRIEKRLKNIETE